MSELNPATLTNIQLLNQEAKYLAQSGDVATSSNGHKFMYITDALLQLAGSGGVDEPIEFNGQVVQPDDPRYPQLKALLAQMEVPVAAAPQPIEFNGQTIMPDNPLYESFKALVS